MAPRIPKKGRLWLIALLCFSLGLLVGWWLLSAEWLDRGLGINL